MKSTKPIVLFDIDYTLFDTAFFKESNLLEHKIYQEVIQVLENLKTIAILGIFSEGNIDFQRKKLRETGIEKYFEQDNTHIVLNKLEELKGIIEKYEDRETFFVDDKLAILFDAKESFPDVFTIWVKRGPFAQNQKEILGFKPDVQVDNLSEAVKIIRSELSN